MFPKRLPSLNDRGKYFGNMEAEGTMSLPSRNFLAASVALGALAAGIAFLLYRFDVSNVHVVIVVVDVASLRSGQYCGCSGVNP